MVDLLEKRLLDRPLVAIARHIPPESTLAMARALYAGGVRFLELTLNTEAALSGISLLTEAFSGTDMVIGAGTVLGEDAARRALKAGARFLVCPHTDPRVIRTALEAGALPLPGVMTPTDIAEALEAGARILKLFPAGALEPDYIRQIRGPFDRTPFLAVGGIDLDNAAAFLEAGCIGWGIGGSLVDAKAIARGDFARLEDHARRYVALLERGR